MPPEARFKGLLIVLLVLAGLLAYSSAARSGQYVRLRLVVSSGQPVLIPEGLLSLEAMRREVAKDILHRDDLPDLENLKVGWKLQQGLVVGVGGSDSLELARKMQDHYRNHWLARLDELRFMHRESHQSAPLAARTIWQARYQASDPKALRAQQKRIEETVAVLEWQIRQPGASLGGRSMEEVDTIRASEDRIRSELRKRRETLSADLLNPAQLRKAEDDYRATSGPQQPFVMPKFAQLQVEILDRQARKTGLPEPLWPSALGLALVAAVGGAVSWSYRRT